MRIPRKLVEGAGILCISPSAYTQYEYVNCVQDYITKLGYKPILGQHTVSSLQPKGYFSATTNERIADFQQAVVSEHIQAIWCMRGGYGASNIIDHIDFSGMVKYPKWLIGFSDITLFHLHLFANFDLCSIHGPMASFLTEGNPNDVEYLFNLIGDTQESLFVLESQSQSSANRSGLAKGHLIGGNLSLIVHTIGTTSEPNWEDKILFIEEIDECLYAIERMLIQLKRRNVFNQIAGLVVGEFIDMRDTRSPFGKDIYQLITDILEGFNFPVGFNFPFGHGKRNVPLIHGGFYVLEVTSNHAYLKLNY